jgi:methionyl-tRNA formyltransferase
MTNSKEAAKKIRIIFMGTPDFALPGLLALIAAPDFSIVGVFTQTDKPIGRKQILTSPPVKVLAEKSDLTIFQPEKIKTAAEIIKNLAPDLIVVIAYGQIIPPDILAIPKFGCVNVHASLLPKYRGAACLNAPILNGDTATGVTVMQMDANLDTGPILRQSKIQLNGRETWPELHDRLAALGAELLIPTLRDWVTGKIKPQAQDDTLATYVKTLKKSDGKIDWTKSAAEIERMVRAYNPWPGTHALSDKKILKILAVAPEVLAANEHQAGEMFLHDGKLAVQCGQGALLILKLQIAGGKALDYNEFLRGNKNLFGQILS